MMNGPLYFYLRVVMTYIECLIILRKYFHIVFCLNEN